MRKRLISWLLVLILCVSLLPGTVLAAGEKKLIAFTFDDGPSAHTSTLLDGLKARGVVATFFMNGVNGSGGVKNYKSLVARMAKEGHQLANHTYSHASFSRLSASEVQSEVSKVESLLFEAAGGSYTELVRTPGGALNQTIRNNVPAPIILWSVDTRDWENRNEETTYQNILRDSYDGAIVLMHDLYKTSVAAALRAVDTLQGKGYEFVTVSELMRRRGVSMVNGSVYYSAKPDGATLPAYRSPEITEGFASSGHRTVSFSSKDTGLTFRYTTDGTAPTLKSPVYTGPITVRQDTRFTVAGFDRYGTRTPTSTKFIRAEVAFAPTYTWNAGLLTLSTANEGATLHYTTDGSTPTASSPRYSSPIAVFGTVKAVTVTASGLVSAPLTVTVTPGGLLFTDVTDSAWYYDGLCQVSGVGLMSYLDGSRFVPNGSMTRAMMVTVLYRMAGEPESDGEEIFTDVKYDSWYGPAMKWAYGQGLVNGMDETHFSPSLPITREQLVTFLCRYSRWCGVDTSGQADLSVFPDVSDVAEYALSDFAYCVKQGLVSGMADGTLSPKTTATRAQCAVLLARFCF